MLLILLTRMAEFIHERTLMHLPLFEEQQLLSVGILFRNIRRGKRKQITKVLDCIFKILYKHFDSGWKRPSAFRAGK